MIIINRRSPASSMLKLLAPPMALACLVAMLTMAADTHDHADMKAAAVDAASAGSEHAHHGQNCSEKQKYDVAAADAVAAATGSSPLKQLEGRTKRQITELIKPGNPDAGSQNPFSQIGELSTTIERYNAPLKMISQLFSTNQQQQQQPPQTYEQTIPAAINNAAAAQQNPLGLPSASQFMSQLTELIRPPRDNGFLNGNMAGQQMQQASQQVQQAGQQVQQAGQQGIGAAQNAQGGIMAALTEFGQGLQRIATSNPNLVPDVKNFFSNGSSKLSQTFSQSAGQPAGPNIVPAQNSQQLADNLAKLAFPGVQVQA